jgi:hypothetical protein
MFQVLHHVMLGYRDARNHKDAKAKRGAEREPIVSGGLAVDELIEPGSVRPELLGEALALVYAGLVARAQGRAAS